MAGRSQEAKARRAEKAKKRRAIEKRIADAAREAAHAAQPPSTPMPTLRVAPRPIALIPPVSSPLRRLQGEGLPQSSSPVRSSPRRLRAGRFFDWVGQFSESQIRI